MSEEVENEFEFINMLETVLEAVEQLQEFFEEDMWYAVNSEWDTEQDMLKYLRGHFRICKKAIQGLRD